MYMYMYVEIGGYFCSGYHYYVAPLSMAALLYSIHGMTRCMGCIVSFVTIPLMTFPNTTWRPSSQLVLTVVMKNCDPFVSFPAFAMLSQPAPRCLSLKFSSGNLSP